MIKFVDAVEIAGTRRRATDGALLADARVARTGIQVYAGYEVGMPDKALVRVYRSEGEVFHKDSLASYAHRPVTNGHPPVPVTADNWRQYATGNTTEDIARDGERVRVPLMVSDAATIADIEGGKRELSAGYTCDLDFTAGVTPQGEAFDALQRNIRINHIAIVPRGRAGADVRIGDEKPEAWGVSPSTHLSDKGLPPMQKITIDGISVEMSDTAVQVVQKALADAQRAVSVANEALAAAKVQLEARDKELGTKDAEIASLASAKLDDAKIDALVEARSAVLADVALVANDVETRGKSVADIRRSAVAKAMGDAKVTGRSDEYVEALFDGLVENAKADPVRRAIGDAKNPATPFRPVVVGDNGQNAYEARLTGAYKTVEA